MFKDAQSTAAFFLSPSSDYYSLSPDSPPPFSSGTTPSATSNGGDESPKNLSLSESQESGENCNISPAKRAGIEIQNFYMDEKASVQNQRLTPDTSLEENSPSPSAAAVKTAETAELEIAALVERKKRDTKVPPKIAKKPLFPPHVTAEQLAQDRRHSWASGDKSGTPPIAANRPTTLHDFKKLLSQQPLSNNPHRKSAKEQLLAAENAAGNSSLLPPFNDGNAGVGGSFRKRNGWRGGGERFSVIQEEGEERKSRENLLE